MYYLQSRYYDPQIGRFINADEPSILLFEGSYVGGVNLYAYCLNNPVMLLNKSASYGSFTGIFGLSGYGSLNNFGEKNGYNAGRIELLSGGGFFNQSLANGNFRSGILYGKSSITALYVEGQARAQGSITKGNINIGIFGKFSFLNANGEIGIGNSEFGFALKGVADIGVATGFVGIIINPSKNDYFIGLEAKAAVASVRGGVQLTLFDVPIEIGGQVDIVGAGFKFGVGIKDGEFHCRAGGGFLLVPSFYIRIKLW